MARLILKQVESYILENGECRVTVSLSCGQEAYTGEVISGNVEEKKQLAVAEATLESVRKLLPQSVDVQLVQSGNVILNGFSGESKTLFYVGVEMIEDSSSQFLVGTCLFTTPTLDIAAKAVLDALNRNLERYISG